MVVLRNTSGIEETTKYLADAYQGMTMKLKIKITGPKVHDVGYRYFLMSMAMSNRIRMFEAHNTESDGNQEVIVFADGEDKAVEAFRALVKTKRPARSEVSNISFEAFDGEIMRIGEYAQFCSTVQLNKAIPVLLDIRDDIKAVRKTTDATLEEIKGLREDFQPGYGTNMRQMQADIKAIKEQIGMI